MSETRLEIRDGHPTWYLSEDIWVVPGSNPMGGPGTPVEGAQAYLWARVHNRADFEIADAVVDFYWIRNGVGVHSKTAVKHGSASVTIPGNASADVLCLRPWIVPGKACVVVETYHPAFDPLSPARKSPAKDPHVAQRNLTILHAGKNSLLIGERAFSVLPFMVNNPFREEQVFTVSAEPADLASLDALIETGGLDGGLLGAGGEVEIVGFTQTAYPGPAELELARKEIQDLRLPPGHHIDLHLVAQLQGDAALVDVIQTRDGEQVGGLSCLFVQGE